MDDSDIYILMPDGTNPTTSPSIRRAGQSGISLSMVYVGMVNLIQAMQFEGLKPMFRDDDNVRALCNHAGVLLVIFHDSSKLLSSVVASLYPPPFV